MKNIPCRQAMSRRSAFTLMEVMVAVMIISVVIAALLQMMGNSSNLFSKVKTESTTSQYASFLIGAKNYGYEDKKVDLYKLTDEFDLDSELRSRLKKLRAKLIYTELESIDMSDFSEEDSKKGDTSTEGDKEVSSGLVFEIGKSTLKFKDNSTSLLRLRIK